MILKLTLVVEFISYFFFFPQIFVLRCKTAERSDN